MQGLDKFREAFATYNNHYVVIGGTACNITMSNTEVRPRATHDIDMIVIVERMTAEFGMRFWDFIKEAGYRPEKRKTGEGEPPRYELYRFVDGKPGYPQMIELLSRHSNVFGEPKGLVIEPLLVSEDVSSLSAIVMDEDYYNFTIEHSLLADGIRHADATALIALKARAYLNLLQEKAQGRRINGRDIRKHRTDILKLSILLKEDEIDAPEQIVKCIREFVQSLRSDWEVLSQSLSDALERDETFVRLLLQKLETSFIRRV
ncbi:MAG: hypothetical protein HUK14_07805 [Muribaculaceae bacterium]|nr:hypothetical protein [Muribaculaceae bacterium]